MARKQRETMEKINLDRKHRLKEINKLSLLLQDTKIKSLSEIRKIAESIEILSDERILNGLNSAIDDFKHGRYTVLSNLKISRNAFEKASSSYQKDINRLKKRAELYRKINDDRKKQIKDFGKFVDKLLSDGRTTKKELKLFLSRRSDL